SSAQRRRPSASARPPTRLSSRPRRGASAGSFAPGRESLGRSPEARGATSTSATNWPPARRPERPRACWRNRGFSTAAGRRGGEGQAPAALLKEAGVAADATVHSANQMLEAMTSFVERSGDLEVARKMITEIGKTSNATGANLSKLGEVAGALDLKLQDSFG